MFPDFFPFLWSSQNVGEGILKATHKAGFLHDKEPFLHSK